MTYDLRFRREFATYFFTARLADQNGDTLVRHLDVLRDSYNAMQRDLPFRCDAIVVMPDHLHAIWTLPEGDRDFAARWRRLQAQFNFCLPATTDRGVTDDGQIEPDVWAHDVLDHKVVDQADFDHHLGYCWWNPVKHGLVSSPMDWAFSSVHRDLRSGLVSEDDVLQGRPDILVPPQARMERPISRRVSFVA